MFQYISCYSLSVAPVVWYVLLWSFNTSHVTLYQENAVKPKCNPLFQYISCYSLSDYEKYGSVFNASFNTSHVTLYRYPYPLDNYPLLVSIHLMLLFIEQYSSSMSLKNCVSIHLMLLFIVVLNRKCCSLHLFQYISCYSLSLVL